MRRLVTFGLCLCGLVSIGFADSATVLLPNNVVYNSANNLMQFQKFNNINKPNVYQYNESPNGQYVIYSRPYNGPIQVFFANKSNFAAPKQLTSDAYLKAYPVVNNSGDYAYAESSYNIDSLDVYYNGNKITTTPALYKYLAMNNDYLAFSYDAQDQNLAATETDSLNPVMISDTPYLVVYNLKTKTLNQYAVPGYIQKIRFFGNSIILNIFNINRQRMLVYRFNLATDKLSLIRDNNNNQLFYISGNELTIEEVTGNISSLILFNAIYTWKNYQIANPFAYGDNHLMRITWDESFWIQGLYQLYKIIQSPILLNQIQNAVPAIANQAETSGNAPLWPETEFSLDHQPTASTAGNAAIIYALLLAVNDHLITSNETIKKITNLAELNYKQDDQWFNTNENIYHHPKGRDINNDGLWLPFNQQDLIGLMTMQLYKLTGDQTYLNRLKQIAAVFKDEWHIITGNRLVWEYSTKYYYAGWQASQHLSVHHPSQAPQTPPNEYEDYSHAHINLMFIERYNSLIDGKYFTGNDATYLSNTLANMVVNNNYGCETNPYLSIYRSPSCIPRYGWALLNNKTLNAAYSHMIPILLPSFDAGSVLDSYLLALEAMPVNNDPKVTINKYQYNEQLQPNGNTAVELDGAINMFDYVIGNRI